MPPVIEVENLSKRYRIRSSARPGRYRTLRDDIAGWVSLPWRWLRPGARNQRCAEFWALKDVSFEVAQGDVLGIVGGNGAGKSTLLKLLTRITKPTCGQARLRGRVGSLLEVGTGFHPELSGRDNIQLSGAILGMSRREIRRKFDEIVQFAEVEQFLDTPVKRYSSGMHVRLGFAVAAHLEPEILLVDEVLAVGDAAFQRKCLGKMSDVAGQGRTVLFVSHNMGAVGSLCRSALWLERGLCRHYGPTDAVVERYVTANGSQTGSASWEDGIANAADSELKVLRVSVIDHNGKSTSHLDGRHPFHVEITYRIQQPLSHARVGFLLSAAKGETLFEAYDADIGPLERREPGTYVSRCAIPANLLMPGRYAVSVNAGSPGIKNYVYLDAALSICVESTYGRLAYPNVQRLGSIVPNFRWDVAPLGDVYSRSA